MNDAQYMALALELARQARGQTTPNPAVGCVVVRDNLVLATGVTGGLRRAWGPHAEVNALNKLGGKAEGATLYVTLEPCSHQGKTPPCTHALLEAGITRVVAGMIDPNPIVAGRGMAFLAESGVKIEVGLMEPQCADFLAPWVHYIRSGQPWVLLKGAASIDGKVATQGGESKWITSVEARTAAHRLRSENDAVLVGAGTVLKDDPELTVRLAPAKGPPLLRVVLDSKLRTSPDSKIYNTEENPTLVAVAPGASPEKRQVLLDKGVEILELPEGPGGLDLSALLTGLGARDITQLMVEGGPTVSASFVQGGFVNEYAFFFAPRILGGQRALGLIGGEGALSVQDGPALRFTEVKEVGPDLLIRAMPAKSEAS